MLEEYCKDLWKLHDDGLLICITTNYGWRRDGSNVMGRGIAREAADRYPRLPYEYGKFCKSWRKKIPFLNYIPVYYSKKCNLLLFGTKELNPSAPHLSWKSESSIQQIQYSCATLIRWCQIVGGFNSTPGKKVYLPRPGCSNGLLDWVDVRPVIAPILPDYVVIADKAK